MTKQTTAEVQDLLALKGLVNFCFERRGVALFHQVDRWLGAMVQEFHIETFYDYFTFLTKHIGVSTPTREIFHQLLDMIRQTFNSVTQFQPPPKGKKFCTSLLTQAKNVEEDLCSGKILHAVFFKNLMKES